MLERMDPRRLIAPAAVCATLSVGTAVVTTVLTEPAATAGRGTPAVLAAHARDVAALGLLRDWDRRRAQAWAAQDPEALRGLYLPGSRAARRDVAMLRQWQRRGVRVSDMTRQVRGLEVESWQGAHLRVRVVDRLFTVRAEHDGAARDLPRGRERGTVVELVRSGEGWQVAAIRRR